MLLLKLNSNMTITKNLWKIDNFCENHTKQKCDKSVFKSLSPSDRFIL